MDERFIRARLTELRLRKGVSEYKMSTDMGHSKSYIQSISSGRSMPSWTEFFYICDYFGVQPKDFFDDGLKNPELVQRAMDGITQLCDDDIALVLDVIARLLKK